MATFDSTTTEHLESALRAIDRVDSFVNVAVLALRGMDGGDERDCTEVLGDPTYTELEAARGYIKGVLKAGTAQDATPAATLTVNDLPRLTDEERVALDTGGIAMQGVPSGDDLSSLIQSFEELGRGDVSDSDQVLACLKELEQRRAASQTRGVPAGEEPDERAADEMTASARILAGLAVFDCYVDSVPDERAKDRYVLWAARDKFEEAYDITQGLPASRPHSSSIDPPYAPMPSDGPVTSACPFCKSTDIRCIVLHEDHDEHYAARCENCAARGPLSGNAHDALLQWNRPGVSAVAALAIEAAPEDNDPNGFQRFMIQTLLKLWPQLTYEQRTKLLNVATKWAAEPADTDPAVPAGSIDESTNADDTSESIEERIEAQRKEMFGAMAIIGVARDSIHTDDNYNLNRALGDSYERLDAIAAELNRISGDSRGVQS